MPQDVQFALPFALGVALTWTAAGGGISPWVREYRLCVGTEALAWYAMWDMPRLAAYGFPYATGAELDLCADAMAFFFCSTTSLTGLWGAVPTTSLPSAGGSSTSSTVTGRTRLVALARSRSPTLGPLPPRGPAGLAGQGRRRMGVLFRRPRPRGRQPARGAPALHAGVPAGSSRVAATDSPISLRRACRAHRRPAGGLPQPAVADHARGSRSTSPSCATTSCRSLEKEEARGDMATSSLSSSTRRPGPAGRWSGPGRRSHGGAPASRNSPARWTACAAMSGWPGQSTTPSVSTWGSCRRGSATTMGAETLRYATATTMLPGFAPGYFESLIDHAELIDD